MSQDVVWQTSIKTKEEKGSLPQTGSCENLFEFVRTEQPSEFLDESDGPNKVDKKEEDCREWQDLEWAGLV